MASTRRLWTGGHGTDLREPLIAATLMDASSVWIVPSDLAARQVRQILASRNRGAVPPVKIWCWTDLWQTIGEQTNVGRRRLSTAAAEAVFDEAIGRTSAHRRLGPLESMIDWPGYRRQLQERFARWTGDEGHDTTRAADAGAVAMAERLLFDEYRELLSELDAEDDAGFSVWASRQLGQKSSTALGGLRQVTILEWPSASPAQWRFLHHAIRRCKAVHVSLGNEDDPSSQAIYEASGRIRQSLLDAGFVETALATDMWRPGGLRDVERSLFRPREQTTSIRATQGIEVQGAPQGDGVARVIARELQNLIEAGTEADDILVLFRHWSEQAERALEIARQWDLSVAARTSLPLERDAAITALLLTACLPIDDWETTQLMRLLRHGQIKPTGLLADRTSLIGTASVLRKSRVFRGSRNIIVAVDRMIQDAEAASDRTGAETARRAREIIRELVSQLEPLDKPRPWINQVDRLFQMSRTLGIGRNDQGNEGGQPALELLRDVLEDQADVIGRTGHEEELWTWPEFMAEIRSVVQRTVLTSGLTTSGTIRFATLAEAAGVRVPYVIVADLVEGSFPSRDAVEAFLSLRPGEQPSVAGRLAASREMLRFLRVLGTAEARISLIYPTTDSKGTELIRAGYLDDLLELFTPEARQACHRAIDRFDASLIDTPELAGSSSDRRTRATALAAARADDSALRGVDDGNDEFNTDNHLSPAEGAAIALNALRARVRHTPFGIHDGLLSDARAIERISQQFGPEFSFSPSQLETYIECPFKFFSKYVLKLDADDDRDELDEDFTTRGSRLHDILEELETLLIERRRSGAILDQTVLEAEAVVALTSHMKSELGHATEVEQGLEEIERERLRLVVARYVDQSRNYLGDAQLQPVPHQLEVDFGGKDSVHTYLELGGDENAVRLRGKIDRIDLLEAPQGRSFRIIDYKSGSAPSSSEVREARLLQLPLYAMAVERVILAPEQIALNDVGYWGLKKEGFRAISFEEWDEVQAAVESYVLALVDRLRRGVFVVDSQLGDCESFCEFRAICRIRQVRSAGKTFDRVPSPELAIATSRRRAKPSEPRAVDAIKRDEDSR